MQYTSLYLNNAKVPSSGSGVCMDGVHEREIHCSTLQYLIVRFKEQNATTMSTMFTYMMADRTYCSPDIIYSSLLLFEHLRYPCYGSMTFFLCSVEKMLYHTTHKQ